MNSESFQWSQLIFSAMQLFFYGYVCWKLWANAIQIKELEQEIQLLKEKL